MGIKAVDVVIARLRSLLLLLLGTLLPTRGAWAAVIMAGLFPFGAHADQQTQTQIQQLQTQVQDLQVRLARIEAVMQGQGLLTLYNDIQNLKDQVAKLNGAMEVQGHQLDQLDRRQLDLYQNLDQRITAQAVALEQVKTQVSGSSAAAPAAPAGNVPPTSASPSQSAGPAPAPVNENGVYEAALARFKKGDYRRAAEDFKTFQKQFPDSALADNAQFWVGYSLYSLKEYKASVAEMRHLLVKYPQTPKAPDALLTISSCQVELNELGAAKATLQELVRKYPHSSAAPIARKRLDLLK